MMPLTLATIGEEYIILRLDGDAEMKKRMKKMGIAVGTSISIVNTVGESFIVSLKDTRIALDREAAQSILV